MKLKLLFILLILVLISCSHSNETESLAEVTNTVAATTTIITQEIIESVNTEFIEMVISEYPQLTNLPTLYIQLDDGVSFESLNKIEFISGTYTLVDGDSVIYEEKLEIKGRGNYSWSFPQKPYALKLETKADLIGKDQAAKRWILVTTYSDKTLLRNYLTLTLAYELGAEYTTECMYVDLYTNGEYHGVYVLTEKIQIHENRVNINITKSALFEIEMEFRHSGNCHYCINLPSGVHIMMKDPDEDDMTTEELDKKFIEVKSFLTAADLSLSMGYDEYSQYIDVKSFVDWYIVNEFVKNYDSNFTTSCYCFIGDDGKLYMGPVWDYDTCYGNQDAATCMNPKGYHVTNAPWYSMLTSDETFKQLRNERWTELRDEGVFDDFITKIYDTVEYISESQVLNHERWPEALKSRDLRGGRSLMTYDAEVEYLIEWVTKRTEWLDVQWYINEN